jgi:hypothetical protein
MCQDIRRLLKEGLPIGPYEVLDYNASLDLADASGDLAFFKKWQKVRFLQDNVIAFQDHVWGDGEIMAGYKCSPGFVVDRYRDGDRWNMLISLRETKSRGDIENFYMESKMLHSFTKRDEWWQVEMYNHTRSLKLTICFPRDKQCQRAVLFEKTRNRATILDSTSLSNLPDGRQVLTWETRNPRQFETYTIKWDW